MPIRPFGQTPNSKGPIATRPSLRTLMPKAANSRRICRFFPSSRTISSQQLRVPRRRIVTLLAKRNSPFAAVVPVLIRRISTTPTNSVYGAMQDGYVERFDQKISPRPFFPSGSGSAPASGSERPPARREGLMPRREALWAGGQRGG